jgi:hypothetical protein
MPRIGHKPAKIVKKLRQVGVHVWRVRALPTRFAGLALPRCLHDELLDGKIFYTPKKT